MKIGILDVSHLVAVRKGFRLTWRLGATVAFLFFVFVWWGVLQGDMEELLAAPRFLLRSFALLSFLGLFFLVALFRRNAYSRALFAFAALSSGLHTLVLFPTALREALDLRAAVKGPVLMAVLVLLVVGWSFVRSGFALCLAFLPWGRCKAYRQQLFQCQRLWPGRWKGSAATPRHKQAQGHSLHVSLLSAALPGLALVFGLLCWAAALVDAQARGSFWGPVSIALLGFFGFALFGFLWNRMLRARIPRDSTPPSRQMTTDSVLLLRSFKDDLKFVPQRTFSFRRLLFWAYEWDFTFEELIAARLASVGNVWLLGSEQDKLPPQGGIRRYVPLPSWQDETRASMAIARMIVAVLGLTENLKWELGQIKDLCHRDKSVFLMPPLLLPGNYRRRWQVFVDDACEDPACRETLLKRVKPRKVLAVCRRGDRLVIVTGESSQMAYESALDIAAILTLGDPIVWDEIVTRYRTPASTRWSSTPPAT